MASPLGARRLTPAPNRFRCGDIYCVLSYSKLLFLFYLPLSLITRRLIPVSANFKGGFPFRVWVLNSLGVSSAGESFTFPSVIRSMQSPGDPELDDTLSWELRSKSRQTRGPCTGESPMGHVAYPLQM